MELTKEQFLQDFKDILHEEQLIKVEDATPTELFQTLARTIRKYITPMWLERRNKLVEDKQKIAYYFSIEFLPGRMLETNLLNLGILDVVKEGFDELGVDFTAVKQAEHDMAFLVVLQQLLWIHLQPQAIRDLAMESAIATDFSNKKLWTVTKSSCLMIGLVV